MRNFILQKFNKLINKALATDAGSLKLINKWHGALLGIEVSDWNLKIEVEFLQEQLKFKLVNKFAECAVQMHADLAAYLAMAKNKGATAGAFKHKLHITGDANFAADCQRLLRDLDIDWEALLADYVGDVPAYRARQLFCKLYKSSNFAKQKLGEQVKDYLREEINIVADGSIKSFTNSVSECRDNCARLEARLSILESK